jgi:hypothetical protein
VLSRIKSFFQLEKGLNQEQLSALARLASEERLAELGVVLHDVCVKTAARFVEEEHRRADSPFRDLAKTDLFHEILVMNFWILESLFKGKRQALMDRVYRHYNNSFVWGWESSGKELMDSMRGKFKTYDKAWDDYSGHQDVFAGQAIGIIFGSKQIAEAPQAAFWLISYADQTMKDFAEIKRSVDALLRDKSAQPQAR